nr:hypothetical protein CFP56_01210 [Quercus suber]
MVAVTSWKGSGIHETPVLRLLIQQTSCNSVIALLLGSIKVFFAHTPQEPSDDHCSDIPNEHLASRRAVRFCPIHFDTEVVVNRIERARKRRVPPTYLVLDDAVTSSSSRAHMPLRHFADATEP